MISQKVYLDERGDDSKDGLSRETAVLTAPRAIAIAVKEQIQRYLYQLGLAWLHRGDEVCYWHKAALMADDEHGRFWG
jgi:hypothetical protein